MPTPSSVRQLIFGIFVGIFWDARQVNMPEKFPASQDPTARFQGTQEPIKHRQPAPRLPPVLGCPVGLILDKLRISRPCRVICHASTWSRRRSLHHLSPTWLRMTHFSCSPLIKQGPEIRAFTFQKTTVPFWGPRTRVGGRELIWPDSISMYQQIPGAFEIPLYHLLVANLQNLPLFGGPTDSHKLMYTPRHPVMSHTKQLMKLIIWSLKRLKITVLLFWRLSEGIY